MLHIHRAVRADALADALAELLSEPLGDPFAAEIVGVPTRGMERWLTQRMSAVLGARAGQVDGICANVLFPPPHRLITEAVATASGVDPEEDPWLPERSVWPLLEVVEGSLGEPWLATLASYLGVAGGTVDAVKHGRRLTTLRHLAGLFHRYALHRPQMLAAWRAGRDVDAAGAPLAPGCAWQAELWRRLRARIGVADLAERSATARERLLREPEILDLPARISVFGLTRLPAGHLEILRALAAGRDLHLFLLHPSPALWEEVAMHLGEAPPPDGVVLPRAADPTAMLPANRLLASWGRDAREMELVLTAGGPAPADHVHPGEPPPETLLGRIQADIRADRAAPGPPSPAGGERRPPLAPGDRSIEVHSCHGRARQVEVVRDAILHALAEDPTLEPRDVIVMCPDIETFAPLIQATFGAGETSGVDGDSAPGRDDEPIDLRVRLADRSLRQTNPVLGVVSQLLELAEQRITASQVLDLIDRGPVRRRFLLDDDDITRLQEWISQAGVRWGLDAAHRAPYDLQMLDNGTWRAGLDRLLLGVTMTEDGEPLFANVLPLDDVDSRSIDLAGRFAELVARIAQAVRSLSAPQPLASWAESIADAADALAATSPGDRWQRAELQRVLDEMIAEAGTTPPAELAPGEIRAFIAERLEGRPTRANFRTGHLTVCTLLPMRSVPHRIVCLLGLDDGAFPRKAPRDGDDLMLSQPLVGERDPRSEDRQLLLDALMATTEQLIITYTGNDERTNAPRPPAVPVGELLDTVDATVRDETDPSGRGASGRIVVRHPLQPFDPRNFTAGRIAGASPWSFDPVALAGARALAGPRTTPAPFLSAPLPPRTDRVVELTDLVRFLEHPVRAFLRQRLGISLRTSSDEVEDGLAVELDPLERWAVGQRLLESRLEGVGGRTAGLAEIARGTLPPGLLGKPVIDELYPTVDAIVAEAAKLAPAMAAGPSGDPVDVRVALADGRLLTGTVSGVNGDVLLTTTFSRVAAKHRIAAWARLLAVTATRPERAFSAATVGRAGGGDVRVAYIPPLAATAEERRRIAAEQLNLLVDLYDRGMREPVPVFCRTSEAYASAAHRGQDAAPAAAAEWESTWNYDHEDRDLEHRMVLGGVLQFAEILELAPAAGEDGEGWPPGEGSRFGRYARRLWAGLLEREELSSR
ncbi:MAG TPA: exodeoxyribonuclease V subunit gamma [Solirubrobacteraceae bacterium]